MDHQFPASRVHRLVYRPDPIAHQCPPGLNFIGVKKIGHLVELQFETIDRIFAHYLRDDAEALFADLRVLEVQTV